MANRIDATLCGMGSLDSVISAWLEQFDDGGPEKLAVKAVGAAITDCGDSVEVRRAIMAIFSARQNQDLEKTGALWSAKTDGTWERTYLSNTGERQAIVALMSD